jgi:hypothetical protein
MGVAEPVAPLHAYYGVIFICDQLNFSFRNFLGVTPGGRHDD